MIKKRLNRVLEEMRLMRKPNCFMLSYPNLPVVEHAVNLNYFHAEYQIAQEGKAIDSGKRNLGDELSAIVVNYMLEKQGIQPEMRVSTTKHLYAVGSILMQGYQDATVWGSGFLTNPSFFRKIPHCAIFRKLDIRCVRGPYTQKILTQLGHYCPKIYGDPAVLLPRIYTPTVREKTDYIVIPHHSTEKSLRKVMPNDKIVSMNTTDYKMVIDKIVSSEKVVTSSLHGIILAEAYGIPAVYYLDRQNKFHFKYNDWYASTGRENIFPVSDLQAAIKTEALFVPDLTKMQKNLIDSFPYDLWEC